MRKVSNAVWQERRDVLRRAEQSGLSLAVIARREGIAYWQLMTWKRRLRELDDAQQPCLSHACVTHSLISCASGMECRSAPE